MHRVAVCPKCESFRILGLSDGPGVYCMHYIPISAFALTEAREADSLVYAEKIQCKVVTVGD